MSRVAKSIKVKGGYPHRTHVSKKGRKRYTGVEYRAHKRMIKRKEQIRLSEMNRQENLLKEKGLI